VLRRAGGGEGINTNGMNSIDINSLIMGTRGLGVGKFTEPRLFHRREAPGFPT